jgi:TonB family protein
MPEILHIDPAAEASLQNYPPEHKFVRWGTTASISVHLLVAAIVLIIAYLNHIKSLRDLMSAAIVAQPPPDEIEIIFPPDETPPPPTDHPEFIKQILMKPPPPPPIIKPKPKPKPKPEPIVQHHSVPHPPAPAPQHLRVGSDSFPVPSYPAQARQMRIQGTVLVRVSFNGSGGVENAEVDSSSGSGILDNSACHFIIENWHDPAFAGQTQTVPIRYQLQ